MDCNPEELWEFHSDVRALKQLAPKGTKIAILGQITKVEEGALHKIKISRFGISMRWDARITEVEPPHGFTDIAERSPFTYWRHRHEFKALGTGTQLRDRVNYAVPFGLIGKLLDRLLIRGAIKSMFRKRHKSTVEHFSK